jgi:tetratricopeptide (TPR) repeat protein
MSDQPITRKRIWPLLVSIGSASVMILAFFIPSIQDQWDRYQSRQVIERYVEMGNDFFEEDRFDMAEKSYEKAFELSEQKRLDIEMKRLNAKINRVNTEPDWGTKPPEDLTEIDFQMLLHLQKGKEHIKNRAATLTSYGVFLANLHKAKEAEKAFREAIQLDSANVMALINLGNLFDQQGKRKEAEQMYTKAISLDPSNAEAHYNLGLLYQELGLAEKAKIELDKAVELKPHFSEHIKK